MDKRIFGGPIIKYGGTPRLSKKSSKGQIPGLDGLLPELYLEIWDLVGTLMLNSFILQSNMGYFIEIKKHH